MVKALLFVHNEKIPVRSHKYPHLTLSRSTTIFPVTAKEYLERFGKGKIIIAEIDETDVEGANLGWLKGRNLLIPIGGEVYSAKLIDEIEMLKLWAKHGVSLEDSGEYNRRLNRIRKEIRNLKTRLFETKSAENIVRMITSLSEPSYSENSFLDSHSKMKKVTSPKQERFKERITDTLIRPMSAAELSRKLNMNISTLRKRMRLLKRSGLVKTTTQRLAIGRPQVVYFLARDI